VFILKRLDNDEDSERIAQKIRKLLPEHQERIKQVADGLLESKSIWDIMTVDDLPHYLAAYPIKIIEWNYIFITTFITVLFYKLSSFINKLFLK